MLKRLFGGSDHEEVAQATTSAPAPGPGPVTLSVVPDEGTSYADDAWMPASDTVISSQKQLPKCRSLTHEQSGPIKLPAETLREVALIVYPMDKPLKVWRLSVPGWLERNTDNISTALSITSQVSGLNLHAPRVFNATPEIIAMINGVKPLEAGAQQRSKHDEMGMRKDVAGKHELAKHPLYKAFFDLIHKAVSFNTADIHIEVRYGVDPASQKNGSRIRFRVDGELIDIDMPSSLNDPATLRGMIGFVYNDMCEGRSSTQYNPNDFLSAQVKDLKVGNTLIRGRFQTFDADGTTASNGDKPFDLVMRILYADRIDIPTLAQLGFMPWQIRVLMRFIDGKSKMASVSGKVGSGKSTTLRSLFAMLPLYWKKYAAEEPVEYFHPNTTQINVLNDQAIEKVLKSLKRGDLNALLMGEVRNKQTLSLLRNITFSGHQGFTTTHSESALGQLPYFLTPEMEMNNHELANPAFIGVLFHQAIVRKLCRCAIDDRGQVHAALGPDRLRKLENDYKVSVDGLKIRNPSGCPLCQNQLPSRIGYDGMDVLAEFFEPDLDHLKLIEENKLIDLNIEWRKSHEAFDSDDCTGNTIQEVGLKKALVGRVDLLSVELKTRPFVDAKVF